jgi:hypothetical protein
MPRPLALCGLACAAVISAGCAVRSCPVEVVPVDIVAEVYPLPPEHLPQAGVGVTILGTIGWNNDTVHWQGTFDDPPRRQVEIRGDKTGDLYTLTVEVAVGRGEGNGDKITFEVEKMGHRLVKGTVSFEFK